MLFYCQNVCMLFADECYNLCLLIGYGRGYIFEPVYDFNSFLQLTILVKYFYSVIRCRYDWACTQSHNLLSWKQTEDVQDNVRYFFWYNSQFLVIYKSTTDKLHVNYLFKYPFYSQPLMLF